MNDALSKGVVHGLLYAVLMAILMPLAQRTHKAFAVRMRGERRIQVSENIYWFPLVIWVPFFLTLAAIPPEIESVWAFVVIIFLVIFGPILIVINAKNASITWSRTFIEQARWLRKPKRVAWDDVREANIRPSHDMRFRDQASHIKIQHEITGSRQLARYARCRLKKNSRVMWDV